MVGGGQIAIRDIESISPLTESTLFCKSARSVGDSSTSTIRSTPPAAEHDGHADKAAAHAILLFAEG